MKWRWKQSRTIQSLIEESWLPPRTYPKSGASSIRSCTGLLWRVPAIFTSKASKTGSVCASDWMVCCRSAKRKSPRTPSEPWFQCSRSMPNWTLPSTGGPRMAFSRCASVRIVLLTFASICIPLTSDKMPSFEFWILQRICCHSTRWVILPKCWSAT